MNWSFEIVWFLELMWELCMKLRVKTNILRNLNSLLPPLSPGEHHYLCLPYFMGSGIAMWGWRWHLPWLPVMVLRGVSVTSTEATSTSDMACQQKSWVSPKISNLPLQRKLTYFFLWDGKMEGQEAMEPTCHHDKFRNCDFCSCWKLMESRWPPIGYISEQDQEWK